MDLERAAALKLQQGNPLPIYLEISPVELWDLLLHKLV